MRLATYLLVAAALTACTTKEPLDVSGTWSLTTTLGAGNCNTVGMTKMTSTMVTFDKTMDKYLFPVDPSNPNVTIAGTFNCTSTDCTVTLTFVIPGTSGGNPFTETDTYDLDVNENLGITGTGTVTATGSVTCSQVLTVSGTVLPPAAAN